MLPDPIGLDAAGIDFSNRYFPTADLRDIDSFRSRLEGGRFFGAYFPVELSAQAMMLSVDRGTRMRYDK